MRSFIPIFLGWCCTAFIISCNKDDSISPPENKVIISNLGYSPSTIYIRPGVATFIVNGNLHFINASGGVASLKLTTSSGLNLTVPIPANNNSQGDLTGTFEFGLLKEPGIITFDIWIVDKKGNASNKLSGSVELKIDDSGNTWSVVTQDLPLFKIAWLNDKYIGLGFDGKLVTSTNGTNWSVQQSGTTASLRDICYGLNQYVVVGDNSTILISTDGVNWQGAFVMDDNIDLNGVAWSGNIFIAVGNEMGTNKAVIMKSTDGNFWVTNDWSAQSTKLNDVTWASTKFVAVGKDVFPFTITSTDGLTWHNKHHFTEVDGELVNVTWTGSVFAAVGFGLAATSTDGTSWNYAPANGGLTGVVWSGHHYIAVGITGIYRSTNGLDYVKCFDTPYIPGSIAWSGSQYVAVGFISPIILVSPGAY
jgi:hypothetical protein